MEHRSSWGPALRGGTVRWAADLVPHLRGQVTTPGPAGASAGRHSTAERPNQVASTLHTDPMPGPRGASAGSRATTTSPGPAASRLHIGPMPGPRGAPAGPELSPRARTRPPHGATPTRCQDREVRQRVLELPPRAQARPSHRSPSAGPRSGLEGARGEAPSRRRQPWHAATRLPAHGSGTLSAVRPSTSAPPPARAGRSPPLYRAADLPHPVPARHPSRRLWHPLPAPGITAEEGGRARLAANLIRSQTAC
jgi:hypothetical protein